MLWSTFLNLHCNHPSFPSSLPSMIFSHPAPCLTLLYPVQHLHILLWSQQPVSVEVFQLLWWRRGERLPLSSLEIRKSALQCAGLYQLVLRGCTCLIDVSLSVSGHASFPDEYIYWEGYTLGNNKRLLLWPAHFETHCCFFLPAFLITFISK